MINYTYLPTVASFVFNNKKTLMRCIGDYRSLPKYANKYIKCKPNRNNRGYSDGENLRYKNYMKYFHHIADYQRRSFYNKIWSYTSIFMYNRTKYKPFPRCNKTNYVQNAYYDAAICNGEWDGILVNTVYNNLFYHHRSTYCIPVFDGSRYYKKNITTTITGTCGNHKRKTTTTMTYENIQNVICGKYNPYNIEWDLMKYINSQGKIKYFLYDTTNLTMIFINGVLNSMDNCENTDLDITKWFVDKNIDINDLFNDDDLSLEFKIKFF